MKYFLVSWQNGQRIYRDMILYAEDKAHAKSLVLTAYKTATIFRVREVKP